MAKINYVPLPADKKIYVVGDSTVCGFNDNYYLPRYGYGTQLAAYLDVSAEQIVNLALSGRSSKSFLTEANYAALTSSIGAGDYLIIAFGHNDEKYEKTRFTDPNGTKETETTSKGTSFKWNLNEKYIKVAKAAGAVPVLCTPIARYDQRTGAAAYTGLTVHVTADGDYPQAIRDLGEETDTTVIDLTALTVAEYKKDNAAAAYYYAHATYGGDIIERGADGNVPYTGNEPLVSRDDTHLNEFGAKMVAYLFAKAVSASGCPLGAHVRRNISAPTKADSYFGAIKKDFVRLPYSGFTDGKKSVHWTTIVRKGWYGTVFGDVGDEGKIWNAEDGTSKFTVEENRGVFTVGNEAPDGEAPCGKISSTGDGIAAVFMRIAKGDNFKAEVTAEVKSKSALLTDAQGAFGMMLRDDIYIDKYQGGIIGNYVVAGFLNTKGAIFSRENGELSGVACKGDYAVGVGYNLEIERSGQIVTVKVGEVSKTYTDFDFFATDNDYMYLCLFANRGLLCEFSDLVFVKTGVSQGA